MPRRAHAYLRAVVAAIPEESWAGRRRAPGGLWTVRQALNHARVDLAGVRPRAQCGPGEDPFRSADALHGDPVAEPAEVPGRGGRRPGGAARRRRVRTGAAGTAAPAAGGRAGALDAAVYAWGIAVATGQIRSLAPAPAADLRPAADRLVPRLRGYGVFAPALASDRSRDESASLLAFLGRDAEWAPPTA